MNPRRRRFVHEYLKDLNGTQACIRAGYSSKGANVTGAQLLANPSVKAAVETAIAQRAVRVEATVDEVVRELRRLASVDIRQAYDRHGALLPFDKMPEDVSRAIVGVECVEQTDSEGNVTGILKKVKFADKKGPLELLGKHLRMFDEQKPATGDGVQTSALKPKTALRILQLSQGDETSDPETKH